MKKFNKTIMVAISVDQIAIELEKVIKPDFKHKESLVEAIIGTLLHHEESLGFVMNALHGWSNELEFMVGEEISCSEKCRNEFVEVTRKYKRVEIGACKIVEIDPYRPDDKLKVSFIEDQEGEQVKVEQWVDHLLCNRIPTEEYIIDGPKPVISMYDNAIGEHDSSRD